VVDMVVTISGITGIIMLIFALLIFSLFIQLTIASCKEEIILLITLGASPKQLRKFLMQQFFPVNILIIAVSIIIITVLQLGTHQILFRQHIFVSSYPSLNILITALAVLLLIWGVNRKYISQYISLSAKK